MKATDNKFLLLRDGVVLTPSTEPVIVALDKEFEKAGLTAYVTRALTDANGQLRVLKQYIQAKGLDKLYPEAMNCKSPNEIVSYSNFDRPYYTWQEAWSHLLNIGVVINPPLAAVCLMDYYGSTGKGPNKKGQIINQTPHVRGNCFDIGGKTGEDKTINDELAVIKPAFERGIPGLINILPEHGNNCIHCDCKPI